MIIVQALMLFIVLGGFAAGLVLTDEE